MKKIVNKIVIGIRKIFDDLYYGTIKEQDSSEKKVFAQGLCLDKIVWVFLISAFIGDILETVYCLFVNGTLMNRSSVIYGPFSVVWGFGAVLLTLSFKNLENKNDKYIFVVGFLIGGMYEYICSLLTEICFGQVFWDYSHLPLNVGGRTSVMFCMIWGVVSVVWIKILYPPIERRIERVQPIVGRVITRMFILLMLCNVILTSAIMVRYTVRQNNSRADTVIERFLDSHYNDEVVENRWPNMKSAK